MFRTKAEATIGGCPIGSLANELAAQSEAHRRTLQGHLDHWAALIEEGLAKISASGCLESGADPKALSITFLTAIQGGLLLAKVQRSTPALATVLDRIIDSIDCHASPVREEIKT